MFAITYVLCSQMLPDDSLNNNEYGNKTASYNAAQNKAPRLSPRLPPGGSHAENVEKLILLHPGPFVTARVFSRRFQVYKIVLSFNYSELLINPCICWYGLIELLHGVFCLPEAQVGLAYKLSATATSLFLYKPKKYFNSQAYSIHLNKYLLFISYELKGYKSFCSADIVQNRCKITCIYRTF